MWVSIEVPLGKCEKAYKCKLGEVTGITSILDGTRKARGKAWMQFDGENEVNDDN